MAQVSVHLSRATFINVFVALVAGLLMFGGGRPALARQTGSPLQLTTTPALYPAFNPDITDYVIPAGTDTSLQVTVNAPRNTKVSVDGQPFRKLSFTTQVSNLGAGQRFSFVVNSPSGSKTYHVRRLPANFPAWTTERVSTPQSEYYIVANTRDNSGANVIIFDGYGVPVWWHHANFFPIDAKLLPNGNLAWSSFGSIPERSEEHLFDGTLVRTLLPHPTIGGALDPHELLLLPNGNYLTFVNISRGPIDLTPYGGASNGFILDHVIEEITPAGELVWQWSAFDHIPLSETSPQWWGQITDPYHMNSIEQDGDGYILSMRHLDAVLRIDRATGAITWKLGGSPRPESLTFVGDPQGSFGGQHDARILPDGTLTVHDNGTNGHGVLRAVRYSIDTTARTATLLERVTDSAALTSQFVGSSRKLPTGNWVTAWGGHPMITELTPDSNLVLRIRFTGLFLAYRAIPITFGTVQREDLRAGMDTKFPR
jgi:hypothetical protein